MKYYRILLLASIIVSCDQDSEPQNKSDFVALDFPNCKLIRTEESLEETFSETTFNYDENENLAEIVRFEDGDRYRREIIIYENNLPHERQVTTDLGVEPWLLTRYSFEKDLLIKEERFNEMGVLISVIEYEYENGLLSKKIMHSNGDNKEVWLIISDHHGNILEQELIDNENSTQFKFSYQYDDKFNTGFGKPGTFGQNNVVYERIDNDGSIEENTFDYTYNDHDLPITLEWQTDQGPYLIKYFYECKD